ncbi:MAG: 30S ribosomal protein S21 [Alphaproteobacteria bacterium]|nr:30S ribosomal protein S21 [Alphaproteobacteria bacterium]
MRIFVKDNNIDQALRFLKKKMQREGMFREMKKHTAFEKPSERRVREKAEAIRRAKKLARKKMQREGLLPMPKPKPRPPGRPGFQHVDRKPATVAEPVTTTVNAAS